MTPQHLRALLAMAGVSQMELARRLGVDGRSVRRWVSGERGISDARREEIEQAVGLRVSAA
jgi:transcriptional regulator with XRE-family HTH domain